MKTILKILAVAITLGGSFALAEGTLVVRRIEKDGTCNLVGTRKNSVARITYETLRFLQYDPDRAEWVDRTGEIPAGKKAREIEQGTVVVLSPITHRVGLFWLEWKEDGQTRSSFVHSGPVLCNDVEIGPPPTPDLIAQCVPGTNSARAVFVSDPNKLNLCLSKSPLPPSQSHKSSVDWTTANHVDIETSGENEYVKATLKLSPNGDKRINFEARFGSQEVHGEMLHISNKYIITRNNDSLSPEQGQGFSKLEHVLIMFGLVQTLLKLALPNGYDCVNGARQILLSEQNTRVQIQGFRGFGYSFLAPWRISGVVQCIAPKQVRYMIDFSFTLPCTTLLSKTLKEFKKINGLISDEPIFSVELPDDFSLEGYKIYEIMNGVVGADPIDGMPLMGIGARPIVKRFRTLGELRRAR